MTDAVKKMIQDTAGKEKSIIDSSGGKRNKQEDFHEVFEKISFGQVMENYMMNMKMLLAKADEGDLDKLKTALTINQKMGRRLAAIIQVREEEEENGDPSLSTLLQDVVD